jgi:excisionase family DNA binding protein
MLGYSTREAAKKLGLGFSTLRKYVNQGSIPLPPVTRVGGVKVRLWSEQDIQRIHDMLPKIANGRKTRHRKEQKPKKHTKPKKK